MNAGHAFVVLCVLIVGCGPRTAANSDPKLARQLLDKTLQAWVSGEQWKGLAVQQPPVFMTEDSWRTGSKLSSYSILKEERMSSNIRFEVQLHGANPTGKTFDRKVFYLVTTTPALTISREEG